MELPLRCSGSRAGVRFAVASVVGAGLLAAASGCSSNLFAEPPCFPPDYSVTPSAAKAGEMVTVKAPGAKCNPRYGENARIEVLVTDEQGVEVINTTAAMTDAGAFTHSFRVPAQMAVGQATVAAAPHNVDWCDDTGRNNRAEGPAVLERASCAQPRKPLTITR